MVNMLTWTEDVSCLILCDDPQTEKNGSAPWINVKVYVV